MSKVTIQQVAQAAGVSKGTVSRVLNGRAGVNDATRDQVLAVVQRMGFRPDPGARQLARGSRRLIGIAASGDDVHGQYYEVLLDALQEVFLEEGYAARVLEGGRDGLPKVQAAALVLLGVHLDDPRPDLLKARGLPFVAVGRSVDGSAWVDVDNEGGMSLAVAHLVKLGHRRIAHLSGAHTGQASFQRLQGYRSVLRENRLGDDPSLVWDGGFSELGGYRAVRRALAAGAEFTAIAAASDEMAIGAIAALDDEGLRVPFDVSVTGFDDLPFTRRSRPALTTVHQPIREVGHAAARILLSMVDGGPVTTSLLPVQLIVRHSTAGVLVPT